jgi:hypothetical protein
LTVSFITELDFFAGFNDLGSLLVATPDEAPIVGATLFLGAAFFLIFPTISSSLFQASQ